MQILPIATQVAMFPIPIIILVLVLLLSSAVLYNCLASILILRKRISDKESIKEPLETYTAAMAFISGILGTVCLLIAIFTAILTATGPL